MQKVEIGVKQLQTAIDMYIDKKDYISAITLAGAAEEVLGKLAERKGHKTAKKDLSDALLKKVPSVSEKELSDKHLNRVRNSLKHVNSDDEDIIEIEPEEEAFTMICRAISNLSKLNKSEPDNLNKFLPEIKKRLGEKEGALEI